MNIFAFTKFLEDYIAFMLRLDRIILTQFKNYLNRSFQFSERIIGISGRNGIGKTNLLDAIHYLCFTRSYFTRIDSNSISKGHTGFRLEGDFVRWNQPEKTICILRETGKKEFSINDHPYERFSQHIGRYPCVIIAPDDIQIITGGSEERRRFIDTLLSQLDALYLQQLIIYHKILRERNALLRAGSGSVGNNESLMAVLDEQLLKVGDKVFDRRKEFLISFLPLVKQVYSEIAEKGAPSPEIINLYYNSELMNASFAELLRIKRSKDWTTMRTTSGIHRDDLEFELNDQSFKSNASQGQRKSLLFALKLAEMEVLRKHKGFSPLLLMDDVFEKLDEQRTNNLLHRVCTNEGQVFITDTSSSNINRQLSSLVSSFEMIEL